MRMNRSLVGLLLCLMSACATSDAAPSTTPDRAGAVVPCRAGEQRACPCLGGGFGTQSCDASGTRFGACNACPPQGMVGAAGMSGGVATSAGRGVLAGSGGRGPGTAGTGASKPIASAGQGGGSAGAAGMRAAGTGGALSSDDRPDPLPAERGATCGLGLPRQCNPDSEKCCKRSLSTHSCIPKAEACDCEESNCTVVSVACDGPEDCNSGQVCCAAGSGRTYSEFACAATCSSASRQACHAKADCSASLTCAISQQLPSISVCTDPRTLQQ